MLRAILLDRYFLFYIIHRGETQRAQDRVRQVFRTFSDSLRLNVDTTVCGLIRIYNCTRQNVEFNLLNYYKSFDYREFGAERFCYSLDITNKKFRYKSENNFVWIIEIIM